MKKISSIRSRRRQNNCIRWSNMVAWREYHQKIDRTPGIKICLDKCLPKPVCKMHTDDGDDLSTLWQVHWISTDFSFGICFWGLTFTCQATDCLTLLIYEYQTPTLLLFPFHAGVCIGTGMVPLEEIGDAAEQLRQGNYRKMSPWFIPRILVNMAAGHVSLAYGFMVSV